MKLLNFNQMNEHPVKTIFAMTCGTYAGITAWIHGVQLNIPNITPSMIEFIGFLLAFAKAVIIGGGSWWGASMAANLKKRIVNLFKKH